MWWKIVLEVLSKAWGIVWPFVKKYWQYILIGVLIGLLWVVYSDSRKYKGMFQRESANVDALTAEVVTYKNKHGEAVMKIGELQYTVEDLEKRAAEDAKMIKDLGIKLKNARELVKTVVVTQIEYRDSLIYVHDDAHPDSTLLALHTENKWYTLDEKIDLGTAPPTADINLSVRDSVSCVLHRVPKRKFLWWTCGTKGYEIEVVSHNPYSHVEYARWISVSDVKTKRDRE